LGKELPTNINFIISNHPNLILLRVVFHPCFKKTGLSYSRDVLVNSLNYVRAACPNGLSDFHKLKLPGDCKFTVGAQGLRPARFAPCKVCALQGLRLQGLRPARFGPLSLIELFSPNHLRKNPQPLDLGNIAILC